MPKTHQECGRMGGLVTKGKLVVTCPFTGKPCHTAPYQIVSEKGKDGRSRIPREKRQEWGRMGRAIAGRGKPKQVVPQ